MMCTTCPRRTASGLGGWCVRRVMAAMPASRVAAPVATTTASASPCATNVPALTVAPLSGRTGTLSPVSVDSSTARPSTRSRRRSAQMRSPAVRSTTSPRTSSAAATTCRAPSRRTVARNGSSSCSRCAARSARYSWANAKAALTTTMIAIATPSCGMPAATASAAAPHRSSAKKCTSCRTRSRSGDGGRGAGSVFGPSAARRLRASSLVSPGEASSLGTAPEPAPRRWAAAPAVGPFPDPPSGSEP